MENKKTNSYIELVFVSYHSGDTYLSSYFPPGKLFFYILTIGTRKTLSLRKKTFFFFIFSIFFFYFDIFFVTYTRTATETTVVNKYTPYVYDNIVQTLEWQSDRVLVRGKRGR